MSAFSGESGGRKFWWEQDFFHWVVKVCLGVIFNIKTFFKAKKNILKILNINKTKISLTCLYKLYEVKMKMVQEQRLQLKMKFSVSYNMKLLFSSGYKDLAGSIFHGWGEWTVFQLVGGLPTIPQ